MKKYLFSTLFLAYFGTLTAQHTPDTHPSPRDSFTVYLFLLENCKISQAYSQTMNDLYARFSSDSIGFVGLFPNPITEEEEMNTFLKEYKILFPCTATNAAQKAKFLGASITPEAVLYNETQGKVLYRGRIDNLFERVGQRRRVVTSFELAAALHAVQQNTPIPIPEAPAVGCFIPN